MVMTFVNTPTKAVKCFDFGLFNTCEALLGSIPTTCAAVFKSPGCILILISSTSIYIFVSVM